MDTRSSKRWDGGRALAPAVAAVVAACGSITFPERPAAFEGEIIGVGPDVPFGSQRAIWVKEAPDEPCGIVFTAKESTVIGERQPDLSIAKRSFADLVVGRTVRVWARNVADSCPRQSHPGAIELIPRFGAD